MLPRDLNASVGASGPHGFAVRIGAVRQERRRVHRIQPRVRDDRDTPLEWGGWWGYKVIRHFGKSEYFFGRDWTGRNSLIRLEKLGFRREGDGPQSGSSQRVGAALSQKLVCLIQGVQSNNSIIL